MERIWRALNAFCFSTSSRSRTLSGLKAVTGRKLRGISVVRACLKIGERGKTVPGKPENENCSPDAPVGTHTESYDGSSRQLQRKRPLLMYSKINGRTCRRRSSPGATVMKSSRLTTSPRYTSIIYLKLDEFEMPIQGSAFSSQAIYESSESSNRSNVDHRLFSRATHWIGTGRCPAKREDDGSCSRMPKYPCRTVPICCKRQNHSGAACSSVSAFANSLPQRCHPFW